MSYHFDWLPIWEHRDILISGFALTVAVSAAALVLAVILGTLLGTLATTRSRLLRLCAGVVVECTRNVPLLIHMYFWYIGLAFLRLPPFLCAVFGLAIYSAAYVGEIVRGGIEAVARGQSQAATRHWPDTRADTAPYHLPAGAANCGALACRPVLSTDQGFFARFDDYRS